MEKISFSTLISTAYREIFTKKMPWIFGSILAFVLICEDRFVSSFTNITSKEELQSFLERQSLSDGGFFLFIVLSLILINAFGKGNLIDSLSFLIHKEGNIPSKKIPKNTFFKKASSVLFIEITFFLLLFGIFLILCLPLLVASSMNTSALPLLTSLCFYTFLFLFFILSTLKQFVFLYALLSHIHLRSAFNLSISLLSKNIFPSLSFSLFSLAFSLLFTFFVNTAILGITALAKKIGNIQEEQSLSLVVSFVLFTWFIVFLQALWILFFRAIALPKELKKITDEIIVEKEEIISEAPTPP